jgi:hypothetical protein
LIWLRGYPTSTTAGDSHDFTVTATDPFDNIATGFTGTVTFTASDAQAVLPADYTFGALDAGFHAFSATLKTAGTQFIIAITARMTGSELNIAVTPAAPSQLIISAPSSVTAGVASGISVTAVDGYGNTATGYTGTVGFTSTDPQAVLPGEYAFSAADGGTHAFSATLKTAGSQSLTATDTVTGSITGSQWQIRVGPAAAQTIWLRGYPTSTTAGDAHGFTVTARDPFDNIATGFTGTVNFTGSDAQAVLPADYTFGAGDAGVHAFTAILKTAGTQFMTATTVGMTGTEGSILVAPAAASKFIITAPSSVTAGVASSITVTAVDAYGNTVTDYTGTIHFTSSHQTPKLFADYTFTAVDRGVRTFSGLVLRKKGELQLTAADTLDSLIAGEVIEYVIK